MLLGYHSLLLFLCFFSFFLSFCGLVNHSLLGCRDSQPLYFLILIVTLFFSLNSRSWNIALLPLSASFVINFFYHSLLFNFLFFYLVRKPDILIIDKIWTKNVNFREFRLKTISESNNWTSHDWTKINLFAWGKKVFFLLSQSIWVIESDQWRIKLLAVTKYYCNKLHNAVPGQQQCATCAVVTQRWKSCKFHFVAFIELAN